MQYESEKEDAETGEKYTWSQRESLDELREYDHLSCFCPLDQKCHIDVLIEML
jgi:hypothetical protein